MMYCMASSGTYSLVSGHWWSRFGERGHTLFTARSQSYIHWRTGNVVSRRPRVCVRDFLACAVANIFSGHIFRRPCRSIGCYVRFQRKNLLIETQFSAHVFLFRWGECCMQNVKKFKSMHVVYYGKAQRIFASVILAESIINISLDLHAHRTPRNLFPLNLCPSSLGDHIIHMFFPRSHRPENPRCFCKN